MKILIVENEALIAEDLKDIVTELKHQVVAIASNTNDALAILGKNKVDCVLLDIRLNDNSSGFDIAKKLHNDFSIPFIFISAHSDSSTVEIASPFKPFGYMVKPIRKESLFAILTLLQNTLNTSIYKVREKGFEIEIDSRKVTHLKADGSYTEIYTTDTKYITAKSLKSLCEHKSFINFKRVHKSYAVNPKYIIAKNALELRIKESIIPIGRKYKYNFD